MQVTGRVGATDSIPTSRVANPLTAALLSSLVPGTGEWSAGARRRGTVIMLITIGVICVVLIRLVNQPAIRLAVQPGVLVFLLVANGIGLVLRTGSAVDAYQVAVDASPANRSAGFRPIPTTLALILLLAFTAAPHVAIAYYGLSTHDLLTNVFVVEPVVEIRAAAPTPADPTTSSTPETTWTDAPPPTVPIIALPAWETTPVADPSVGNPPTTTPFTEQHDRITVLLIGGDAGPGRGGLRTDTMIIATMEPATGSAALFSVPRNLGAVPLPGSFSRAFEGGVYNYRLNHLYGWATDHPWYFPDTTDPGADALMQTIGQLLGLPIDYYAVVDLGGFVDLIDALGGVDLYVPEPILDRTSPARPRDDWIRIDLNSGYQHLTGSEALAYARSRSTSSDYARMDRQRCVLGAIVEQAEPIQVAVRIPALVPVLKEAISTNIPLGHLPDLAETAAGLNPAEIISVRFIPPTYTSGYDEFGHPIPRANRIRETVRGVLEGTFDGSGRLAPTDLAAVCG